jgi:hypothetical protein
MDLLYNISVCGFFIIFFNLDFWCSFYNSPWSSARKRKRRKQLFSKSREEQLIDEITMIIPSVLKTLEKVGLYQVVILEQYC